MHRPSRSLVLPILVCAAAITACAGPEGEQTSADAYLREHYAKSDYMVPMRDGVELFTIVYTPRDTSMTYPVILFRTPYSIAPYGPDEYREPLGPSAEFDRDGYIFVFQERAWEVQVRGWF